MNADPRSRPPSAPLDAPNPYAPPRAVEDHGSPPLSGSLVRSRTDVRPPSPALKWAYLTCAVLSLLATFGPRDLAAIATMLMSAAGLLGLCWVHGAWAARPYPRDHRDVSPNGAVGRMFIPFYGLLYWMFVANRELAHALDPDPSIGLAHSRHDALNARTLATIACGLQIVATVGVAVLTAMKAESLALALSLGRGAAWFFWMVSWEGARKRLLAAAR